MSKARAGNIAFGGMADEVKPPGVKPPGVKIVGIEMAGEDTKNGMTNDWRHVHGPRPIAALVPPLTRTAFARAAPSTVHLQEFWASIMGPKMALVTTPKRLSKGTLTVLCSGPVAMELQHMSTHLIERINLHLGGQPVQRLRFLQILPVGGALPAPRPRPTAQIEKAADAAVAQLPEGPLRDALAALGRAILTETASRLGKQPRTRY